MKKELVSEEEIEKVKNRYESEFIFNSLNYLNVASNLAFFELIGKAEDINKEVENYRKISARNLQETAIKTFIPENCCTLLYKTQTPCTK